MAIKVKKKPIQGRYEYGLHNVSIQKFSFEGITDPELRKKFSLEYDISPRIATSQNTEHIAIALNIKGRIKETSNVVIGIDLLFEYRVKDLHSYVKLDNGKTIFPKDFHNTLITFVSIAISTSRGILMEKLKGTIYQTKFVPTVDPNVFFKKKEPMDKIEPKGQK